LNEGFALIAANTFNLVKIQLLKDEGYFRPQLLLSVWQIETLFMHLEKGVSMDEFLEDFPSVTKAQVIGVLSIAEKLLTSKNIFCQE
jgi:hypothetical protein